MNGDSLSNFLVWWLVSGLFVATAFQCVSKKKLNGRGPANSASGFYERGDETIGVINDPSREAEGNEDGGTTGHSVSVENGELISSVTDKTGQSSDGRQEFLELEAIKVIADKLSKRLDGDGGAYKDFLSRLVKSGDESLSQLSYESWDRYYKPCSRIWIYLEQLGLSSIDGVNNCSYIGSQDIKTLLSDFLRFLLNKGWNNTSYASKSERGFSYGRSFQEFIKAGNSFHTNVTNRSLVEFLRNQKVVDTDLGEYRIESVEELQGCFTALLSLDQVDFGWYWAVSGTVGYLTLMLTKIEWYLKKLFGNDFVNYRKNDSVLDLENVLDRLIEFYRGSVVSIKYADFPGMKFDQLYDQVKAALKRTQNPQS